MHAKAGAGTIGHAVRYIGRSGCRSESGSVRQSRRGAGVGAGVHEREQERERGITVRAHGGRESRSVSRSGSA